MCALHGLYPWCSITGRDNRPEAAAIRRRYLTAVVREGLQRVVLTATLANVHALALLGL